MKNKVNVALDTFLDFADVGNYFTFKLSALKRFYYSYIFWTTNGRLYQHHFRKPCQSFARESKNLNPSKVRISKVRIWIFSLLLLLTCYNFSINVQLYRWVVLHLWHNIFTHIYTGASSMALITFLDFADIST